MEAIAQQQKQTTDFQFVPKVAMNDVDLHQPNLFINRELSLLQFNRRVLEEARDETIPLLERLKYVYICSANLDEFFEVRVAGVKQQVALGRQKGGTDSTTPQEMLQTITEQAHQLSQELYDVYSNGLIPALSKQGIHFLSHQEWNPKQEAWIKRFFRTEILPILSPIGLDFAHPFPRLVNKSLNYIVTLTGKDAFGRDSGLAMIHAPRSFPRVIKLPEECSTNGDNFVLLNSIIQVYASELFIGMTITGCYQFRVTRNSELLVDEENIDDLALAIKNKLLLRRFGTAVRLEVAADCPADISEFLLHKHDLNPNELYHVNGPVNLSRFRMLLDLIERADLRFPPFTPSLPKPLQVKHDFFEVLRSHDVLVHHPYHAFTPVLDFLRQATIDPNVVAIKQTLYRTDANSPIVTALVEAARAVKQVTAVIELRARFDEENNIELANRLQEAGALVVYGVAGFKTHAKFSLIVRRENKQLRYYAHMSTGNYHADTARGYTDFGLFTYNQEIADDVQNIFQQLTGMGRAIKLKKLLQAPFTLFKALLEMIDNETKNALAGKPARITAKMNSLTDPTIISALYAASRAGVKINLIVRGVCSLRPGIPGVSENIRVRSIIGRFLEHSRVYCFHNNGEEKIFCASADWMERNFYHRVEVCFPIEDKQLAHIVKEEGLNIYLSDNMEAWELQSDGSYKHVHPGTQQPRSAQQSLLNKYC